MVLEYQCNIQLQDCPTLYPEGRSGSYDYGTSNVKFTDRSCVRDQRLDGNIGRCGFPGAPCIVNETVSNCASGSDTTCVQGVCQGGPGYPCLEYYDCNYGSVCDRDVFQGSPLGVCGGADSTPRSSEKEKAAGLDFGRAYCASGTTYMSDGDIKCAAGPLAIVTNATYAPSFPTSSPLPALRTGLPGEAVIAIALGGLVVVSGLWLLNWKYGRSTEKSSPGLEAHEGDTLQPLHQSLGPSGKSDSSYPGSSTQVQKVQLTPHVHKQRILQFLVSLVLQLTYFSIVIMACVRPIILPRLPPNHRTEAKGLATILTIAWQTLALFPIRGAITDVFASEWSHSYKRTQELIPGTTDQVSVATAGFIDRAKHLFTSKASRAFCLAFSASIAALALGAIAPGALSVDTVFVQTRATVDVGSISLSRSYSAFLSQDRALLAAQTEQFEGVQFRATLQDRSTVVALPRSPSLTETPGNLTYASDVVRFDYACRWAAPKLVMVEKGKENSSVVMYGAWAVEGKEREEELWEAYSAEDVQGSRTWDIRIDVTPAIIIPLEQRRASASLPRTSSDGTSAWLFIGGNSTSRLNLGDIPSTPNTTHLWWIAVNQTSLESVRLPTAPLIDFKGRGPLASILLCNPRMNVSSAMVTFSPESRYVSVSTETLGTAVGNISPGAAALLLSRSLQRVTSPDGIDYNPLVGRAAAPIFLQERLDGNYLNTTSVPLRPVANISASIGAYVSSAVKAWADGYVTDSKKAVTVPMDAVKEVPSLALVGSVPLTIAAGVLAVIVLGLSAGLLWAMGAAPAEPLGIGSLMRIWEQKQTKIE